MEWLGQPVPTWALLVVVATMLVLWLSKGLVVDGLIERVADLRTDLDYTDKQRRGIRDDLIEVKVRHEWQSVKLDTNSRQVKVALDCCNTLRDRINALEGMEPTNGWKSDLRQEVDNMSKTLWGIEDDVEALRNPWWKKQLRRLVE